ncbi:neurogenic locus notch homolog protein 1-like, partial [Halyomorpha halys]|uniref:neurogenic locus notch homolog protein 1-like n=1 Tax=Halyomorpha halys TaxID=286706 RepID=UPI0034D2F6AD
IVGARCEVVNHNPICSCPPRFTGDPFIQCQPILETPSVPQVPENPCIPSPCGPHSQCKVSGNSPSCSCLPEFKGLPPNCRPECVSNGECPSNLACINQKCKDPCPNTCGTNADCRVISHTPQCLCSNGYTGDPFVHCTIIQQTIVDIVRPCQPSPCGANAVCREQNGAGSCTCLPEYIGNPYEGCRPECVVNTDCPSNRACIRNKCQDPCPGTCGQNAVCQVASHLPLCSCNSGYTGDPFKYCTVIQPNVEQTPVDPCNPSPCGANSQCKVNNEQAICSCLPEYIGSPPGCRPECVVSSECPSNRACLNQKCSDPCPGTCGRNTQCQVINHSPICSCLSGFTGDPFSSCHQIPPLPVPPKEPVNPCVPSPCGPYSQCQSAGDSPSCSCLPDYTGSPPNCRPECTINSECPSVFACLREKCRDPCPGSCGLGATCSVRNHIPICLCQEGYTGDPFTNCHPIPPPPPEPVNQDPCNPSPCGSNAQCNNGVCTCLPEYQGDPYTGCRPECVLSSECSKTLACINNKCRDPCPGTCGQEAICEVVNHIPVCRCQEGKTGNPFISCQPIVVSIASTPCRPSPCGPYSQCRAVNDQSVCSCLVGYHGTPPSCRPECIVNSDCGRNEACNNQKCKDPCPGTCGVGARCEVINHNPICSCPVRFTGDPFVRCQPIVEEIPPKPAENPCIPSPCGPNSQCKVSGSSPSCSCLPDFLGIPPNCRPECISNGECSSHLACINQKCKDPCPNTCGANAECRVVSHIPQCTCSTGFTGDPFVQCTPVQCKSSVSEPECVLNNDCPRDKACIRNKCTDPCPGTCGQDARCDVLNHIPICSCPPGMSGNPFVQCKPVTVPIESTPCQPSPCGPNSQCRAVNGQSVCSCLEGYKGMPPSCRPECVVNSDCGRNEACNNQKCRNPCTGTCGIGARCQVVNHNPICSCPPRFTGDPFIRCQAIPEALPPQPPQNPCVPSPCGPNSQCKVSGDSPSCSCLPDFLGVPPNCRPECISNGECSSHLACVNQKCKDPCPNTCGTNTDCQVISHTPQCVCRPGFTGDPFIQCTIVQPDTISEIITPCQPSPCGANAICREQNGAGSCSCLPEYIGNPYEGCRPECVLNSDCPSNRACIKNKCQDPCPGTCGQNAECHVVNHIPVCTCNSGYTGDPFKYCNLIPTIAPVPVNPCNPSPCGANSQCKVNNEQAICSCLPQYIGSPPGCRPECVVSAECPSNKACMNQKCVDPCIGTCGQNTICQVINHSPICSCKSSYTGDPFTRCYLMPKPSQPPSAPQYFNPCLPSPCGPNSQCRNIGMTPSCSCLPEYTGSPPNCRPECLINAECSSNLACIREKCRDPCPGSCGIGAVCNVFSHTPVCTCPEGYTGDPFTNCVPKPSPPPEPVATDPCNPSPCGANAQCADGVCTCLPEYQGDPYTGCRPECVLNNECPRDKACIRNKCTDPCPGTCGSNALCEVINHIPTCKCPEKMRGNPFIQCLPAEEDIITQPCTPSPCGPNSVCRELNNQAICACLSGYLGSPPSCRPECVVNSDCSLDKACTNLHCLDPCPGSCGLNAECIVINHNPICKCPIRYTGDPFTRCYPIPENPPKPIVNENPCIPSPCGPYSSCKEQNGSPSCSCLPNYIGSPPNCRPECISNSECSNDKACINQRCIDPCPGSCGSNAECRVVSHTPNCFCPSGFIGDPFTNCYPRPS